MKKITALFLSLLLICGLSGQVFAADSKKTDYSSMTASEFVENISVGWNLGNTLDALDGKGLSSETSWGNPKTTKAMIKAVKSKGFNTVRIPVSWGNHMDQSGKIDKEWLDRVQEVVDYAYSQDMFVILNSHHDRSWIKLIKGSEATVTKKFKYLWKQIAVRFKNYDERLIFEAMNEPNTEGSYYQWTGGTKSERQVLNRLNKAFAETVRAAGGKNSTRFIMIPPYGASAVYESMAELEIPDDRTIVSIHAYAPDSISLNLDPNMKKFTDRGKGEIDAVFSDIKKAYTSKGIPVIMGEFGTMNKGNTAERVKAAKYYLQKADSCGIPCIWWDNGINEYDGTSETFGLLDRSTLKWYYPDIVNALTASAAKTQKTSSDTSSAAAKTVKIGNKSYKTSMTGTLNLSNQKLKDSDIADLKYMTNLSEIILSNNELTDLSALSGLTQLEKLTFHNNNVNDLSFAKNLTKLTVIGAENNGITSVSALSKLTKLSEIWLKGNSIKDISPLKNCVNVTKLSLSDNPLGDISSLSGMKKLKELHLGNCGLKSIKALSGCSKLETVYLFDNKLTDLTPLAGSKKLALLDAKNNRLNGKLQAIKGLTVLDRLDISGNGYNDPDKLYDYVCTKLYSDDDGFEYWY